MVGLHCLGLLLTAAALKVANSQIELTQGRAGIGNCQTPDTGSLDSLVLDSLKQLGLDLRMFDAINSSMVCEAPGLTRGTINSFSVVVEYMEVVGSGNLTIETNQFQFDCNANGTFTVAQIEEGSLITQNPLANLTTALSDQCGRCVDPELFVDFSDPVTHCARKSLNRLIPFNDLM